MDPNQSMMELYCIETFTANSRKSQNKVMVRATLHGENNFSSEALPLITSAGDTKKIFHKGSVDSFYMVAAQIPNLNMITLYCEDGKPNSWLLNYVLVRVNGRTYKAVFNKWMGEREQQFLTLVEDKAIPFQGGLIHLGPILKFRGNFEDRFWRMSAMIVTEHLPYLNGTLSFWKSVVDKTRAGNTSHESPVCYSHPPVLVYQQYAHQMWRFDFDVELNSNLEQICYYKLPQDHRIFSFKIPALSQKPGILFCSCNDRAHPYRLSFGEYAHKCAGWLYMEQVITKPDASFHLLVMGGDQIYADPLFAGCESVRNWENLPNKEKWENSVLYFTPKTVEELNVFYFKMYIYCWNLDAMQRVTSSVPTAMIYDDHDIFDGWGSLNPKMNDSHMLSSIFQIAKKYFFLFQMQGETSAVLNDDLVDVAPDNESKIKPLPSVPSFGFPENLNDAGPFNVGLTLTGGVSVVLYDLRTERRMFTHDDGIIMTENSYRNIERWLKTKHKLSKAQHLFAVLSVPIHYPDASLFNKMLDVTNHNLIDDVRDHYSAVVHRSEQARVLHQLATFGLSAYPGSRVSILTGDVHVGGYSVSIVRPKNSDTSVTIEQYISSGIVAKPPPKFAQKIMSTPLFRNTDKFTTDRAYIIQQMKPLPDGKRFLSTQNFLRLIPSQASYNAMWVGCPKLTEEQKTDTQMTLPLANPTLLERLIM